MLLTPFPPTRFSTEWSEAGHSILKRISRTAYGCFRVYKLTRTP